VEVARGQMRATICLPHLNSALEASTAKNIKRLGKKIPHHALQAHGNRKKGAAEQAQAGPAQ